MSVMERDLQLPGRSTVYGTDFAAATSQPAATFTAMRVMSEGGNAVDAAIAACAVLAVTEPMSTGPGGDCFALIHRTGRPTIGYNGSGRAPAALDLARVQAAAPGAHTIDPDSALSVTVPGAVEAWARLLADHGTWDLDQVLAPAIALAEAGFAVAPRCAADWARDAARLAADPGCADHFLPHGRAPQAGDRMRLPALGATLRAVAQQGAAGFYEGAVAQDLCDSVRARGGVLAEADLAGHAGTYVTPLAFAHHGHTLLELPPNGHGIVAQIMLGVQQGFDLAGLAPLSPERLHLQIEAARLAWGPRDALIADPDHADVPVEAMLAPAYLARLRAAFDPGRAMATDRAPVLPGGDTVYLTTVDRDGTTVSLINSIFHHFGAALCGRSSGVLLQNRGCGFSLQPGHPNVVAPGKRPLHTIIPGMVLKDGDVVLGFGVMGGPYQPVGHAHVLTNLLDFDLSPQAALDLARVFPMGCVDQVERGVPAASVAALAARGHVPVPADEPLGGGQMIRIDRARGTLAAASDPRKDGLALAR